MKEKNIYKTDIKLLYKPPLKSYKGQNGIVLIVGGSKRFHGAPLFAAKIASRVVDLVYFSSVPENNKLLKEMKCRLFDFIAVPRKNIAEFVKKVDAILIGPGMGVNVETKKIANNILKNFSDKKIILDADALRVVNKRFLGKNCVVTPHAKEFEALFGMRASKEAALQMACKYNCIVVLKGFRDYVSNGKELFTDDAGNPGMTKGGTGDVLAGLITALAAKNDLFLAAKTGVLINGLAGDELKKRVAYYYNASDLTDEIPKIFKKCLK